MLESRIVSGMVIAAAMALHGSLAAAQEQDHSQEVEIYGGEIFGDRLTETPISGSTPRLNDAAAVGFRYNYNFNRSIGTQLEVGYSPHVATGHVASGDTDGVIVQCDLDAVWNTLPDASFHGHRIAPYAVAGGDFALEPCM